MCDPLSALPPTRHFDPGRASTRSSVTIPSAVPTVTSRDGEEDV
jgi:hypothetical protein